MGSLRMEWSATSATRAYLDTIKLCNYDIHKRQHQLTKWKTREPGSSEFISALAAGMKAKLIVEVTSAASPSTIALAAAARQTGGRLVCILPEPGVLAESKRVIKDSGLKDLVEFEIGDPSELLANHSNVDFSLVDCAGRLDEVASYARLLTLIDVNPRRSVVVANNYFLAGGRKLRFGGDFRGVLNEKKIEVRSVKQYPIGRGMEVITMIEKRDWGGGGGGGISTTSFAIGKDINRSSGCSVKKTSGHYKSNWIVDFDEESGEEHMFRVPK